MNSPVSPLLVLFEKLLACLFFGLGGYFINRYAEVIVSKVNARVGGISYNSRYVALVRMIGVIYVVLAIVLGAVLVVGIVRYITGP